MGKLWELYFSDEITREEFLSMKSMISDKKSRFNDGIGVLDGVWDDVLFFRDILDFVIVEKDTARLWLKNDESAYIFDRMKKGRQSGVVFRGSQKEIFQGENDNSHHG